MLQQGQGKSFFITSEGFIIPRKRTSGSFFGPGGSVEARTETGGRTFSARGGPGFPEETDASLDEAARSEREYVRKRLREELKREPTEQELDEWLRQHTEGY